MNKETARAIFCDLVVAYREVLEDSSDSTRLTDADIDGRVSEFTKRWDEIGE